MEDDRHEIRIDFYNYGSITDTKFYTKEEYDKALLVIKQASMSSSYGVVIYIDGVEYKSIFKAMKFLDIDCKELLRS